MEKQKKKLTISGKPKKNFLNQQNFESKNNQRQFEKKFSKPVNKFSTNFKKNFKTKPLPQKLSDYERRKLAEQKATKNTRTAPVQTKKSIKKVV